MTTEARERFERVILPRVEKAVKAIKLIGNGAGREYEVTAEDAQRILGDLRAAIDEVEARYARRFSIDGTHSSQDAAPPPAAAPAAPRTTEGYGLVTSVQSLDHGRVPMLVAAVPDKLLSSVITQLVHRAMELVETRKPDPLGEALNMGNGSYRP